MSAMQEKEFITLPQIKLNIKQSPKTKNALKNSSKNYNNNGNSPIELETSKTTSQIRIRQKYKP